MRLRSLLMGIFMLTLVASSTLADNPAQKLLVKIEIQDLTDLQILADLPLSLNLRTDEYLIVTLAPDDLNRLIQTGFTYQILDQAAWTQPYFLISEKPTRPAGPMPPLGEIIYQHDRETVVKIPEASIRLFQQAGFSTYKLSEQPLPLQVNDNRTLKDLELAKLSDPVIRALINRVSEPLLRAALQRLQDFRTRFSGSDSVYVAGQWILDQFKKFGYSDVVFDTLDNRVEGKIQRNVICTKPGKKYPDKIVMLGGHYDSIVFDGTNPYVWAPGVDDNATGAVAALEAARVLADIELDATVKFACWAAEEQGLHGSRDWATKARNKDLDVHLYINFDMIGNLNDEDPIRDVTLYADQASQGFAELMAEMARSYTTLVPRIAGAGGGSDHYPFIQNGYNIVYGAEGARDFSPHWHRRTDTIDNVNLPFYKEVVQTGLAMLTKVAGPPANIPGAFVSYRSHQIDDDLDGQSQGNNNGFIDAGEILELFINITNVGDSLANAVSAVLSVADPFVTIIDSIQTFGSIAPRDSATSTEPFIFRVASNAPNEHGILFSLRIQDEYQNQWENFFMLKVRHPDIFFLTSAIQELAGDGDNIPEAGELCNLILKIKNAGSRPATGITTVLQTFDPDIMITDETAAFADLAVNATGDNQSDPFTFSIAENALNHAVEFTVQLSEGEEYYQRELKMNVLLGQTPVLMVADAKAPTRVNPYLAALNRIGVPIAIWDTEILGTIPADSLVQYEQVIWFTGGDASETLTEAEQANLKNYLDQGGHLLLSGDYVSIKIGRTDFFKDYLHAKLANIQTQIYHLKSVVDNPVTDVDTIALSASTSNWPTEVDPISPAVSVLVYDPSVAGGLIRSSGTAALAVDNGQFKIVFCSFSLETILSDLTRAAFIEDVLSWFNGAPIDMRAILKLATVEIDDDSLGSSQGDGDGFINPDEQIELTLSLHNRGALAAKQVQVTIRTDNSLVSVIDSTATFDQVVADSTASGTDDFLLKIDHQAPHLTPVDFEMLITDSLGNRWQDTFQLLIQHSNSIRGQVVDAATGQGVPQANIVWIEDERQIESQTKTNNVLTDEWGHFNFALPIGTYQVIALASGFVPTDVAYIELPPDTLLNFILTSPELSYSPDSISVAMDPGITFEDTLILQNTNTGKLYYSILEMPPQSNEVSASGLNPLKTGRPFALHVPQPISTGLLAHTTLTPPDPTLWKLVHFDVEEGNIPHDLAALYIQNDQRNIFFKQRVHQKWYKPNQEFIYVIFLDVDGDFETGGPINNIGAEMALTVGTLGNLILQYMPALGSFDPIPGDATPHHVILPEQADSLEIGVRLSRLQNPKKLNLVAAMLDPNQVMIDVAPDNGLYHIPYSTFDAHWFTPGHYYGFVEQSSSDTICLHFNSDGLSAGNYSLHLVIENNQPGRGPQVIPIQLNIGHTGADDLAHQTVPKTYALHQNYPNPFSISGSVNAGTVIKYQLPKADDVILKIYNTLGQEVATLVNASKKVGYHQILWNGRQADGKAVASGIYFYKLKAGNFVKIKKMLIMH